MGFFALTRISTPFDDGFSFFFLLVLSVFSCDVLSSEGFADGVSEVNGFSVVDEEIGLELLSGFFELFLTAKEITTAEIRITDNTITVICIAFFLCV